MVLKGRAKQLLSIGVRTPHDLATADSLTLCSRVEYLYPQQATRLIAAAKVVVEQRKEERAYFNFQMLLTEKIEALQEEAEQLMMTLLPTTPD